MPRWLFVALVACALGIGYVRNELRMVWIRSRKH